MSDDKIKSKIVKDNNLKLKKEIISVGEDDNESIETHLGLSKHPSNRHESLPGQPGQTANESGKHLEKVWEKLGQKFE